MKAAKRQDELRLEYVAELLSYKDKYLYSDFH